MTSESRQLQGEPTVNLALGNQTASLMKYLCFLLVDLENLQPSGSAGIMQLLSSDHSEDNHADSVPK